MYRDILHGLLLPSDLLKPDCHSRSCIMPATLTQPAGPVRAGSYRQHAYAL
jgi:hypothetical protein